MRLIKFVIVGLCVLTACSKTTGPNATLLDKGFLPLSGTNAYLGSNLFLGKEMTASHYLYNFIKAKGGPSAIELENNDSGRLQVTMYYPVTNELYIGEKEKQGETTYEWIISGPYRLNRNQYRVLKSLTSKDELDPVFAIDGDEVRFARRKVPVKATIPNIQPTPSPSPIPTPQKRRIPVKKAPISETSPTPIKNSVPKIDIPINTDQQAIAMSQGFAERSSNGDIVHTIESDTDTLEAIAKWYAGDSKNSEAIAKINNLTAPYILKVGERIRIPLFMIKEFKRMPPYSR